MNLNEQSPLMTKEGQGMLIVGNAVFMPITYHSLQGSPASGLAHYSENSCGHKGLDVRLSYRRATTDLWLISDWKYQLAHRLKAEAQIELE